MHLYPFKFEPILKRILWGGSRITRFKGLENQSDGIGESWELSQVSDSVSVVANGALQGKSLSELLESYPEAILGMQVYKRFGTTFPLLVKFIDAEADLSIQVHPDDALAQQRHQSFGKTEMWYVMDAKPGARLVSGFSKQIDAVEYERRIAAGTIEEVLQTYEVQAGDVFFIPAGRVHAIGAGIFLAEIQQNSNITYRIYDYNRTDAQGNPRDLHTEWAKDAIDFKLYNNQKTNYVPIDNGLAPLVSCPYFTTNRLSLVADGFSDKWKWERYYNRIDSFVILVCLKGEGNLVYGNTESVPLRAGETILLPAQLKHIELTTNTELLVLETYMQSI
jgi:mannose-6-phosphate isomerase